MLARSIGLEPALPQLFKKSKDGQLKQILALQQEESDFSFWSIAAEAMPDKETAHVLLTLDAGEQDFDSERVLD